MKHRKKVEWSKLDNAAKIFPPNSNMLDTKVFRIACELYDYVDEELLQEALDETIEKFPLYKSVLRKGFFWYYLERSNMKANVTMESTPVCARIYNENRRNLLFRVSYYKKRINLEVYHALTDGTGAQWFMKTLLFHYLTKKYKDKFNNEIPPLGLDASVNEKMGDSFLKYYTGNKAIKASKRPKAYRITGTKREENRMMLIEGSMSVKEVLNAAHEYNTTLTIYLTSLFIYSIYKEMSVRGKRHPIVLSVPVNLRNYFKSESARNFFSTIYISYQCKEKEVSLQDVIERVNESFKEELTEEKLEKHIDRLIALEHNLFARVVPLFLKDITLRIANHIVDKGVTAAISNIGKIKMPDSMKEYIHLFDIFTSARRPQICMCSYEDNLVVSFTSPHKETDIQKNFFRLLSDQGIKIEIASNKNHEV